MGKLKRAAALAAFFLLLSGFVMLSGHSAHAASAMMPIRVVITSCADIGFAVEKGEITACRAALEKRARQAKSRDTAHTEPEGIVAEASFHEGMQHYMDKRGTRVYSPREIREIRNRNMKRMNMKSTHRR